MKFQFPAIALVRRELLVTLRRKRAFLLLVLVTGGVMLQVLANWPDERDILFSASQVSLNMLNTLGMAALLGGELFLPGLAGSAISSERDNDCYDMLRMTLIGPTGILLGKLANAMGFFTLLVIGMLPILGLCFFQVGVSWGELLVRVAALYAFALAASSVGLLCSAWCRRATVAITLSYIGVFLLLGPLNIIVSYAIIVLSAILRFGPSFPNTPDLWLLTSPLPLLMSSSIPHPWACVVVQGIIAVLAIFLASVQLRRTPKPAVVKQEKVIDDEALLDARRRQFPYYLADPCRRRPVIEDMRNPMLVKEIRWGFLGKMTRLIRTFYISFFGAILLATLCAIIWAAGSMGETLLSYHLTQATLVSVLAPGLLANIFTKEREFGNFDMLRMTLMTKNDVLWGKIGAALITLSPLLGASVLASSIIAVASFIIVPEVNIIGITLLGFLFLAICTGFAVPLSLCASLLVRGSAAAILLAYALCFFFLGGLTIAAEIAVPLVNHLLDTRLSGSGEITFFLTPIAALIYLADHATREAPALPLLMQVIGSCFLIRCSFGALRISFGRYYGRGR